MKELLRSYKQVFTHKKTLQNMLIGTLLFAFGLFVTYFAYAYTTTIKGPVAEDLFLSNLPTLEVSFWFFFAIFFMGGIAIILSLLNPRRAPFILIATGIFFAVRAFFLILTHLSPPNIQYYAGFSTGTDLFFSGHVGYAFLLALLFWRNRFFKILFIALSIVMAGLVLLGHLHYSIDVFSAYFIVYVVFIFSKRIFKGEYEMLLRSHL
ncbi:MAG: phosphatase PAP2 family protein [Candidatus Pacebacteria bacterium]|nr:phosphatase PAP2 family protein [Candidatus Paceibacterota bacterium]